MYRIVLRPGIGEQSRQDWSLESFIFHPGRPGNVATLGGLGSGLENDILEESHKPCERIAHPWTYLNTNLKNTLKVLAGLVPAFLTFFNQGLVGTLLFRGLYLVWHNRLA